MCVLLVRCVSTVGGLTGLFAHNALVSLLRQWLAASNQLINRSHRDAEPKDKLSICFTTHLHSHTNPSGGRRRYGRRPWGCIQQTKHSSSEEHGLPGLGDLAEPWLTLIGSLDHTASHLDVYWLVDLQGRDLQDVHGGGCKWRKSWTKNNQEYRQKKPKNRTTLFDRKWGKKIMWWGGTKKTE